MKILSIQRSILCFALSLLISQNATAETSTTRISRRHTIATPSSQSNSFNSRNEIPISSPATDINVLRVRGGAKTPTTTAKLDPTLNFIKIAIGSMLESCAMYAVLNIASRLAGEFKDNNKPFVTAIQLFMVGSVVFGSSIYGSLIDNGLSASTKQLFSPNDIPGDSNWYQNLKKPSWNPPGWVFPIMWLIISKPTQFVALWKVRTAKGISVPLFVYCIQLALGDAWNKIFFGLQQIKVGVAVISAFWAILVASAALFYQKDPSAGLFLVPTCLWVTVAASLNWSIYYKNRDTVA